MICGRIAFEVDEIASSSSSHSPEELISKSFDYVLAEGKTPACSSPDNCGHTINNWVESRWHNLQTVISVRALEHLGEFHREPPHPNRSYKHICGICSSICIESPRHPPLLGSTVDVCFLRVQFFSHESRHQCSRMVQHQIGSLSSISWSVSRIYEETFGGNVQRLKFDGWKNQTSQHSFQQKMLHCWNMKYRNARIIHLTISDVHH